MVLVQGATKRIRLVYDSGYDKPNENDILNTKIFCETNIAFLVPHPFMISVNSTQSNATCYKHKATKNV